MFCSNAGAAQLSGLPVGRLILTGCFLGGAAAGLAGMVEVAAVHGRANASLAVGYGYTGILVAFLARHHPLAIIPVAVLLGGIGASGGLPRLPLGVARLGHPRGPGGPVFVGVGEESPRPTVRGP